MVLYGARVQGCKGARVQGCKGVIWCKGARVQWCNGAMVQWCARHSVRMVRPFVGPSPEPAWTAWCSLVAAPAHRSWSRQRSAMSRSTEPHIRACTSAELDTRACRSGTTIVHTMLPPSECATPFHQKLASCQRLPSKLSSTTAAPDLPALCPKDMGTATLC